MRTLTVFIRTIFIAVLFTGFVYTTAISQTTNELFFELRTIGECQSYGPFLDTYAGDLNGDAIPDFAFTALLSSYSPGGSFIGNPCLFIYLGDGTGTFNLYERIEGNSPAYPRVVGGDWNNDGVDDLFYDVGYYAWSLRFEGDNKVEMKAPYSGFTNPLWHGDFNGDGNQDILAYYGKWDFYVHVYTDMPGPFFFGDGTGQFEYIQLPFAIGQSTSVSDLNNDGIDDIAFGRDTSVYLYFGETNRDTIFSMTTTIDVDMPAEYVHAFDADSDSDADLYVASSTSSLLLINQGDGRFVRRPFDVPEGFDPLKVIVGDLNGDGWNDLVSWCDKSISIALGNGPSQYRDEQIFPLAFIESFNQVHIIDIDMDGMNDLLVFVDDNKVFNMIQRTSEVTVTPTPAMPTPTPVYSILLPSTFPPPPDSYNSDVRIEDEMIGADRSNPSYRVYLNDCNAQILNSRLFGPERVSRGYINYLGITLGISGQDKTIQLIDTSLEPPYDTLSTVYPSITILIRDSTGITVKFQGTSRIELERRAIVNVVNSTNVTLEFDTVYGTDEIAFHHLDADSSSVIVKGAWIQGWDGQPSVCGECGKTAVSAKNHSTVTLIESRIGGGKGGAGVNPGMDAPPYTADETSQVIFASTVGGWGDY